MKKVGITGGIGSGKSTVCKVFELLGAPVYYADDEAKKMLDFDTSIKSNLIYLFGNSVLNDEGTIDRKKLASIVFNDKAKLEKLNSIIHPAVASHFEEWCQLNKSALFIIKEAAILFESNAYKQVDKIITVVAPVELKIERVLKRDATTKEDVLNRMANQMSDEEKIKKSDFVINNDEQQLIIPQVLVIAKQLS
ncbi:MAG: dephospho-CoA kinase [Bacteroidia bacterium]|nr:dephospho-CoA kinase [Bacteroidia bacterium]